MSAALFVHEGGRYHPTELAGGPWDRGVLHGGPPCGLLAHGLERAVAESGFQLARMTVDLLRPVPRRPLRLETVPVREGRRVQVVDARLLADGRTVCRASALMLRTGQVRPPPAALAHEEAPRGPDGLCTRPFVDPQRMPAGTRVLPGFHTSVEARCVSWETGRGHGTIWMRLPMNVVEGEPLTPLSRVAALADFGNGVGQIDVDAQTGCINADVTMYLHRLPEGEWIGLEARALLEPEAVGVVRTRLYDAHGPIGHVLQALLTMPKFAG